jgi:hypothetical protein
MVTSTVPIYLGCAGLIVGSLGLGAQHLLGGKSVETTNTAMEQPLFARSVEEASLPASRWSSQNRDVAYYEPMVELLTTPARSVPPVPAPAPQANPPAASHAAPAQATESVQQEPRPAPREIVRDVPQQTRPSKRSGTARTRDDAIASTEQVAPREERAQDTRSRSDRRRVEVEDTRRREGERRVVVREEPEQRIVRGPEQRDFGFSPFRLFGIFDR